MKIITFSIPLLLFYFFIWLNYKNFIPIFDAGIYYRCLQNIHASPVSFSSFSCAGHPTYIYMLLQFLLTLPFKNSLSYFNFIQLAQLLFTSFVFYKTLSLIDKRQKREEETNLNFLVTLIFATLPMFLSNFFHFNMDNGILIFTVPLIYFVIKENLIIASLFGCALVYTKETGVFAYFFTLLSFLLAFHGKRSIQFIKKHLHLLIPFVLFIFYYFIYKRYLSNEVDMWSEHNASLLNGHEKIVRFLTYFNFIRDTRIRSALYFVSAINFQWFLWIPILAVFVMTIFNKTRRKIWANNHLNVFLTLCLPFIIYAVTRFMTVTNARYYLMVFPFLFLLFRETLIFIPAKNYLKKIYLTLFLALSILSNFYTFDPLANYLFGTLPYGKDKILHTTKLTADCLNCARDQIVYNMQYLSNGKSLDLLFNILHEEKKQNDVTFVSNKQTDFFYFWYVHPETGQRTHLEKFKEEELLPLMDLDSFKENKPKNLIYLSVQFFRDDKENLNEIINRHQYRLKKIIPLQEDSAGPLLLHFLSLEQEN